jgi:hypothetical protein
MVCWVVLAGVGSFSLVARTSAKTGCLSSTLISTCKPTDIELRSYIQYNANEYTGGGKKSFGSETE